MYLRTEAEARILVLAPTGRDARLISETLSGGGLVPSTCLNSETLLSNLSEGAAAAIVAEEALSAPALERLSDWLKSQPSWSDFPFVVLTSGGRPSPTNSQKARELESLGNMTLLERPVRPDTVKGALRAALRARMRQYETRHRQEALAQVNADLEQFAHSASHDLREPIRNIAVYTELIANRYRHALDDQARLFLEYVRTGAMRMETLVNDLLTYTEASAIEDAVHDAVDPGPPLELALASLQLVIRSSGASVNYDKLCRLRIKEVHLQQLFQNLIGNAIKYRSEQAPEIRITTKTEKGWCFYSIQDNGIGIPSEYHGQIFEIFKRLHTNTKYPGTGVGLAICRRIVERYGGNIWVESELGKGSNFQFKIPL